MSDWTDAELSALRRAYATGQRSVTYDGRSVVYDSGEAMLARIQKIERDIAAQNSGASPPVAARARFGRGL